MSMIVLLYLTLILKGYRLFLLFHFKHEIYYKYYNIYIKKISHHIIIVSTIIYKSHNFVDINSLNIRILLLEENLNQFCTLVSIRDFVLIC